MWSFDSKCHHRHDHIGKGSIGHLVDSKSKDDYYTNLLIEQKSEIVEKESPLLNTLIDGLKWMSSTHNKQISICRCDESVFASLKLETG